MPRAGLAILIGAILCAAADAKCLNYESGLCGDQASSAAIAANGHDRGLTTIIDGCYYRDHRYTPAMHHPPAQGFGTEKITTYYIEANYTMCQKRCQQRVGCSYFGFWAQGDPDGQCWLAGPDAVYELSGAKGCISGPKFCPTIPSACTDLPGFGFPGNTADETEKAWPNHRVPHNFDCWPRSEATGFYGMCDQVTVLEDTAHGWPGKCLDLKQMLVPFGESCSSFCQKQPTCSVYQIVSHVGQSNHLDECWHGTGVHCFQRENFVPYKASRIMHGRVRVLANLSGVQIMGLDNVFDQNYFVNQTPDAYNACRNECYSNIGCQYWQYSASSGCWMESPNFETWEGFVEYPITTQSWRVDGTFAKAMVAGEYIQHICPTNAVAQQTGTLAKAGVAPIQFPTQTPTIQVPTQQPSTPTAPAAAAAVAPAPTNSALDSMFGGGSAAPAAKMAAPVAAKMAAPVSSSGGGGVVSSGGVPAAVSMGSPPTMGATVGADGSSDAVQATASIDIKLTGLDFTVLSDAEKTALAATLATDIANKVGVPVTSLIGGTVTLSPDPLLVSTTVVTAQVPVTPGTGRRLTVQVGPRETAQSAMARALSTAATSTAAIRVATADATFKETIVAATRSALPGKDLSQLAVQVEVTEKQEVLAPSAGVPQPVPVVSTPQPTSSSGLPVWAWALITISVALVVIGAIVAVVMKRKGDKPGRAGKRGLNYNRAPKEDAEYTTYDPGPSRPAENGQQQPSFVPEQPPPPPPYGQHVPLQPPSYAPPVHTVSTQLPAYMQPASTSYIQPAGTSYMQPAPTSYIQPAGTSYIQPAGTSYMQAAGGSGRLMQPATAYVQPGYAPGYPQLYAQA